MASRASRSCARMFINLVKFQRVCNIRVHPAVILQKHAATYWNGCQDTWLTALCAHNHIHAPHSTPMLPNETCEPRVGASPHARGCRRLAPTGPHRHLRRRAGRRRGRNAAPTDFATHHTSQIHTELSMPHNEPHLPVFGVGCMRVACVWAASVPAVM